jgi:hypothetical protein
MLLPSLGFGVTLHIPDSWDAWAYHGRRFLFAAVRTSWCGRAPGPGIASRGKGRRREMLTFRVNRVYI